MQAMSLRSLSVVAILWTVGVAILGTKIGGVAGYCVGTGKCSKEDPYASNA